MTQHINAPVPRHGIAGFDAYRVAMASAAGVLALSALGFATLDLHRKERCGFPEVIFAEGKTAAWVEAAIQRMGEAGQDCFVTRLSADQSAYLSSHFPQAEQDRLARTLWLPAPGEKLAPAGRVLVLLRLGPAAASPSIT